MSNLQRIKELAVERAEVMADLESVTNDLRVAVVKALEAGEISELGAHKLTGVSRTTLRTWAGKLT
jgi:hypothetical protein